MDVSAQTMAARLVFKKRQGLNFRGGVRVPTILWGPTGTCKTTCDKLASTLDTMPTLAALAGTKPPPDRVIDGENITTCSTDSSKKPIQIKPLLLSKNASSSRPTGQLETSPCT